MEAVVRALKDADNCAFGAVAFDDSSNQARLQTADLFA
jgi:hypothetical protein